MNTINDMQNRRDFLKTAAFAALGSGMAINSVLAGEGAAPALFNINKSGVTPKMKLRFFSYELRLRHVFTVAAYSRTTTPDVQVEIAKLPCRPTCSTNWARWTAYWLS